LKLATRRIEPRLENKLPAIFETGVSIQLTIDPAEIGAEVKINKIEELPRTINMSVAKFPADLLRAGWSGEMKVRCMVGVTGLCTDMEVLDAKALPKSARQFGLDSMKAWRFLPQRLNGKPIEYEMVIPITMTSDTPSDSRHVDRMNRRP